MDSGVLSVYGLIFIVFLVIPGMFFKRFYFSGSFHKQFFSGLFADRIVTTLFWGIFVQLITFVILNYTTESINYSNLRQAISTIIRVTNPEKEVDNEHFANALWIIVRYESAVVAVSVILGFTFFHLVQILQLDIVFRALQFQNQWHYFFKGKRLNHKTLTDNSYKANQEVAAIYLNLIADTQLKEGKYKNVSGFLSNYTLCKSGNLEYLYLTSALRYSNSKNGFIPIPGDVFVIPFSKIIDMNVHFIEKESHHHKKNKPSLLFRKYIFPTISILLLVLTIVAPFWVSDVSIIFRVFGFFTSLFSWLLVIAVFGMSTDNHQQKGRRLTLWVGFVFFCFIVALIWITCYFYNIPIIRHIISLF